jgi:hypothetical protein
VSREQFVDVMAAWSALHCTHLLCRMFAQSVTVVARTPCPPPPNTPLHLLTSLVAHLLLQPPPHRQLDAATRARSANVTLPAALLSPTHRGTVCQAHTC